MAAKNPSDPRTDRHPGDASPGSYPPPPPNSNPKPAPGGVGNEPAPSSPTPPTNPSR